MLRTTRPSIFGAVLAALSLLAIAPIATPARAASLPPGSYQKTCTVTSLDSTKGVMTASCGCGQDFCANGINTDFPYADCASPIENHHGDLFCTWDMAKVEARAKKAADAANAAATAAANAANAAATASSNKAHHEQVMEGLDKSRAALRAAEPAMSAGAVIVLGQELGNQDAAFFAQQASNMDPAVRAKVDAHAFQFTDAVAFLKKYIGSKQGEHWRNIAIDNAYWQVFGRKSTPTEQVFYYNRITAGQAWYATIVTERLKDVAPGSALRDEVATRVAKAVYGRAPTAAELDASRKSGTPYAAMVEAGRQALWSNAHIDELVATVTRALSQNGRPANDEAIKSAIEAYRPGQATFQEMTSPVGKAKIKF